MGWSLILRYSWKNIIFFVCYSLLIFLIYHNLGWYFIDIPFEPLTVIGIAVAFYVGFKIARVMNASGRAARFGETSLTIVVHGERNISSNGAYNYIKKQEYIDIKDRPNPATHLIKNQAMVIIELRKKNIVDGFQEMQLQALLEEFYNLQGMCERIKNTPSPGNMHIFQKFLPGFLCYFSHWDC